MTDTPRTDHAWRGREAQDYADSAHVVSLDLARTLERELIVCEALLEKTEKAHEAALKEAVAKEREEILKMLDRHKANWQKSWHGQGEVYTVLAVDTIAKAIKARGAAHE